MLHLEPIPTSMLLILHVSFLSPPAHVPCPFRLLRYLLSPFSLSSSPAREEREKGLLPPSPPCLYSLWVCFQLDLGGDFRCGGDVVLDSFLYLCFGTVFLDGCSMKVGFKAFLVNNLPDAAEFIAFLFSSLELGEMTMPVGPFFLFSSRSQ